MDTVKGLIRTKSFWVFITVALLGGIGAIVPIPLLGVIIAALTIFGVSLQGVETVLTQKEIDHARTAAAAQHAQAMQEIAQARTEAATQHTEALREIDQARTEAANQSALAMQEITKARNEARAELLLLQAEKFATSLLEKDEIVNEAVALCPDFRQREYRQLGLEMSAAVIGNVDFRKWQSMQAARYSFEAPYLETPLEESERAYFIDHAIGYLRETALPIENADAQGLVYLACMYGYLQQYDEMMEVLDQAGQVSDIVQIMKDQFRERPMMLILVGACGTDEPKLERLRKTLKLPRTTEQFFIHYILNEYPQNPNYRYGEFIKWVVVRKSEMSGASRTTVVMISPVYPSGVETTYAYALCPDGRQEPIVPVDQRVPLEELYGRLNSSFILFCHID